MTEPVCRACGSGRLETVLSLGKMPLANALLTQDQLALPEPRYPLELAFCPQCGLAQITESVDPGVLFTEYSYFSSYSTTMLAHSEALAGRLIAQRDLGPDSLVMEIASNDGYLLQHYVRSGVPVLGIDPARNVVPAALERGVPTICAFFGPELAEELRGSGRRANVLHANNVLAHVPDIDGLVHGMGRVLADDGLVVVETPYVRDLVEGLEFDTIYHEHLFYYSATALDALFERNGLTIVEIERIPIHGGSLRAFASAAGASARGPSVRALLEEERELGLDRAESFHGFAQRVEGLRDALTALLGDLKDRGHRLAGYGAAAKGTVMLNALGIGRETLDFVADRSPHKQGLYVPGAHIPIVAPERILEDRPDEVLLLAWNVAEEILEQQREYRSMGGRFIIPIPEPRIV